VSASLRGLKRELLRSLFGKAGSEAVVSHGVIERLGYGSTYHGALTSLFPDQPNAKKIAPGARALFALGIYR
jgi:hypothetical protein